VKHNEQPLPLKSRFNVPNEYPGRGILISGLLSEIPQQLSVLRLGWVKNPFIGDEFGG
jgi:hypothetical protein